MQRHDDFSSFEWHFTTCVAPYIYFDCVKLFSGNRNVLYVLIFTVDGKTFLTTDVDCTQKGHYDISHYHRLDDVTIKK